MALGKTGRFLSKAEILGVGVFSLLSKSGKKQAHKHRFFGPVALGTTPGLSQGQTQVFSLFYTMEAQFVPGTDPVCPWDNPEDERWHKKSMC